MKHTLIVISNRATISSEGLIAQLHSGDNYEVTTMRTANSDYEALLARTIRLIVRANSAARARAGRARAQRCAALFAQEQHALPEPERMKSVSGEKQASSGRLSWYSDLDVLGLDEVELLKDADHEQRDHAGLEEVELPEGLLQRQGDERRAGAVLRRATGGAGQLGHSRLFRAQCVGNWRDVRGAGSGCAPAARHACPYGSYRRRAATPSPWDAPSSRRGIGRACKSRAGLQVKNGPVLWGKDHARSVRAMRSRGVEPTLRRLRRRCHLHWLSLAQANGGEPVRTWICTFAPPQKESNESAVQPIERSSAVNENPVFVLHALKPACID